MALPRCILTKGVPGSGKSFWARQFVKDNPGWVRVCRDDIRDSMGGEDYKISRSNETKVYDERDQQIEEALEKGLNIVIDETFVNPVTRMDTEGLLEGRATVEYKDFTDVPLSVCLERNKQRTGRACVPESVIKRFHKSMKIAESLEIYNKAIKYTQGLPDCVLVDMDGTLSIPLGRSPFDTGRSNKDPLNEPVGKVVNFLPPFVLVFIVTGREEKYREVTEKWLAKNNIRHDSLHMRVDGDKRPDTEVKKEIFNNCFSGKYNVLFILEDRARVTKMYRKELNLTVFQVGEGDY